VVTGYDHKPRLPGGCGPRRLGPNLNACAVGGATGAMGGVGVRMYTGSHRSGKYGVNHSGYIQGSVLFGVVFYYMWVDYKLW